MDKKYLHVFLANRRIKKILILSTTILFVYALLFLLILSPLVKYLIEKYDEEYLGRNVTVGWVYINPFTGFLQLNQLKVFESNQTQLVVLKDTLFLAADALSVDIALYKLFSKTIEVSELTLVEPTASLIQNKQAFNYDDIIKKFAKDSTDTVPSKFHLNICNIKISKATLHYYEQTIPVNYWIKDLEIVSSGIYWNADTIVTACSFSSGTGSGKVRGNFTINSKTLGYHFNAIVNTYDLKFIEQYFKEFTNYGTFRAMFDATLSAYGNFNNKENIRTKGMVALSDFHFGKSTHEDYASFETLRIIINDLCPKDHLYDFDTVSLYKPYFKYERYDYLDNMETMFGKNGVNITAAIADTAKFNLILEIANYVKVLAKNFLQSDYQIASLAITDGRLKYNDFSLSEKFSIEMNPLFVYADSINRNHKWVTIKFNSMFQPYGKVLVNLVIDPSNSNNFNMQYHVQQIPIPLFNPYLIYYTSFPFDRGTIELNGSWKVNQGKIVSNNHLLLIDPRATKRLKNDNIKWIPSPLILFFIRERGNVIDYEIPITGTLKSPILHLHDVVMDVLENIFLKPVTTPYRIKVRKAETMIERSLALQWPMLQAEILPKQKRFLLRIVEYMKENTEAHISIYPMMYKQKEQEYISLFEAKKMFYLSSRKADDNLLTKDDLTIINRMSVKDSLFTVYLNKQLNSKLLFTVQEKCNLLVGETVINEKYTHLIQQRKDELMNYFSDKTILQRVHFRSYKNITPYNGFSFYSIVYRGQLPVSLIDAYMDMEELDNESPRDSFDNDRQYIKKAMSKY